MMRWSSSNKWKEDVIDNLLEQEDLLSEEDETLGLPQGMFLIRLLLAK